MFAYQMFDLQEFGDGIDGIQRVRERRRDFLKFSWMNNYKLNHINIHNNFDSHVLKILIIKSRSTGKLLCNYKIFRYKNKIYRGYKYFPVIIECNFNF